MNVPFLDTSNKWNHTIYVLLCLADFTKHVFKDHLRYKWVKVTQSFPTLCEPMDCTVHGILQARILDWVAFLFSRGSSQPRDQTQVSRIAHRFFTSWARREALSRLVIASLPRSKRFLISWLQSLSAVILEPKKIKPVTTSTFPHLFAMKWWDQMTRS